MAGDDLLEEEAAYLAHRILGCIGHVRRTPQGPRAENVLKFPTPALPGSGSKGHSLTRETLSPSGLPVAVDSRLLIITLLSARGCNRRQRGVHPYDFRSQHKVEQHPEETGDERNVKLSGVDWRVSDFHAEFKFPLSEISVVEPDDSGAACV